MGGIRFAFDEEKAAQAVAYLIRLKGGRIDCTALLQLLYLADRRALAETGHPITGDRMVALPHGPVLSGVYDLIGQDNPTGASVWRGWIVKRGTYGVALSGDPPADRLSRYDTETLDAVYAEFGGMGRRALREFTHGLPEWEDPHGSSRPIRPERILEAEGKTPVRIERYRAEAERAWFLHRVLSSGSVPA